MNNPFSKLAVDDKNATGILILCALFVVFDLVVIFPWQFGSLGRAFSQTSTLSKDIKTLDTELVRMQQDKENKNKVSSNAKQKRIIREEEISSVLQYVAETANRNNVMVAEMRPVAVSINAKSSAATGAAALKAQPRLINLNISGGYHQLGKFINELENAETLFNVQEFVIRPGNQDYLIENAVITLATYVKN